MSDHKLQTGFETRGMAWRQIYDSAQLETVWCRALFSLFPSPRARAQYVAALSSLETARAHLQALHSPPEGKGRICAVLYGGNA